MAVESKCLDSSHLMQEYKSRESRVMSPSSRRSSVARRQFGWESVDPRPSTLDSRLKLDTSKVLNCYYPGEKFPAISITESECALNCKHCGHHYLKNMAFANTPEQLKLLCTILARKGVNGILISGGCDANGSVPLGNFIDTITEIKTETNLLINVHTGLIDNIRTAQALAKAGVDVVAVDIIADTGTIQEIYDLEKTPEDYRQTLQILFEAGIPNIVPHICIGLHYGELKGEFKAIEMLNDLKSQDLFNPGAIVFIVFIPTKDTELQNISPPKLKDITKVLKQARSTFINTPILLGCMRPKTTRADRMLEIESLKLGINGIVLPAKNTIEYAEANGFKINKFETCCAINR